MFHPPIWFSVLDGNIKLLLLYEYINLLYV